MTVFLGTLSNSMKEVKAPFVFDGQQGIALDAMQGNQTSCQRKAEVSWFVLS